MLLMIFLDHKPVGQLKSFKINRNTWHRFEIEIAPNRFRSHAFKPSELCELFQITPRTLQRWTKDTPPKWALQHLALISGALMPFAGFDGFVLDQDGITTPAGHTITPGALETLAWRNQENRALWRRVELQEREQDRLRLSVEYWRNQAGAPQAANDD